jgi:hypothetical protein
MSVAHAATMAKLMTPARLAKFRQNDQRQRPPVVCLHVLGGTGVTGALHDENISQHRAGEQPACPARKEIEVRVEKGYGAPLRLLCGLVPRPKSDLLRPDRRHTHTEYFPDARPSMSTQSARS